MRKLSLFLAVVLVAGFVFAEGSVTETKNTWRTMNSASVAWVSGTNGIANGTLSGYSGAIERVVIAAGNGTDQYSLVLTDVSGADILTASGAASSNAVVNIIANMPQAVNGDLTVLVTGTIASSNGTFVVYWR